METEQNEQQFRDGIPFLGGSMWIDLLNSTLSPDGITRVDFLDSDTAFAQWSRHAGLEVNSDLAKEHRATAELRDILRLAFDRLAKGAPIQKSLVAQINAILAKAPFVKVIEQDRDQTQYHLREVLADEPRGITSQIASDFAFFLTDHERERLKHCANPACTMVFYDRGKNNRRRWCSSAVCGNRDKVANYRKRKAGLA